MKGFSNQFKNLRQENLENQFSQGQKDTNCLQDMKYITEKYNHLIHLNSQNAGYSMKVQNQMNPMFFVIKSFTEEDIHKSIKYSCWSSTKEGNKKLNKAYLECKSQNSEVFLFFSMNGSGRFVGVTKMNGEVDDNIIFDYWAMDDVWKGLFPVEWVFIKDIPNKFLKDIKLSNNGFKPVTNSRDTQEIPRKEGEQFLKIFEEFKLQTCIIQHFEYYDERQVLFENSRLNAKK